MFPTHRTYALTPVGDLQGRGPSKNPWLPARLAALPPQSPPLRKSCYVKSALIVCNWWGCGCFAAPAEPFSGRALAGKAGQRPTRNMHSSVRDLILLISEQLCGWL